MNITPNQRRFHLARSVDVSGVSGTGERLAEGCLFSNGRVVLVWLSTCSSTNIYDDITSMLQVHGHGGTTRIIWDDEDKLHHD